MIDIMTKENRCPHCDRKLQKKAVGYVCKNWKCPLYWKLGNGWVYHSNTTDI